MGKNKTQKYNKATTIVLVIALIVVVAVTGFMLSQNTSDVPVNNEAETSDSAVDVTRTTLTSAQLRNFIDSKQTGFVYIGRPTCPHCAIFTPILNEVLRENGRQNVHYYNTDEARKVSADELSALMSRLGIEGVPAFIFYRDGIESARLENVADKQALIEFFAANQ